MLYLDAKCTKDHECDPGRVGNRKACIRGSCVCADGHSLSSAGICEKGNGIGNTSTLEGKFLAKLLSIWCPNTLENIFTEAKKFSLSLYPSFNVEHQAARVKAVECFIFQYWNREKAGKGSEALLFKVKHTTKFDENKQDRKTICQPIMSSGVWKTEMSQICSGTLIVLPFAFSTVNAKMHHDKAVQIFFS